jgi:hypothetical protein
MNISLQNYKRVLMMISGMVKEEEKKATKDKINIMEKCYTDYQNSV